MSIIKVNAIQHTSSNVNNMTMYANGNVSLTTANTILTVGNTVISNAGISVGGASFSPYGTMKNRIINGDMRIDQRFAGAANNNVAGNQYVVDRWANYATGAGKLRYQQNNTNGPGQTSTQTATGFLNYFGANTVSANTVGAGDAWILYQAIEGLNISDLNWGTNIASPVTLSFWVYSSIAGTHGGRICNSAQDRSYPFTYNISSANTWQYQTVTIPGDTTGSWFSNNNIGMWVMYPLGVGSSLNGTNNTWSAGAFYPTGVVQEVSSANGAFYLTGVQLEKGTQATSFDFRHYTTELQLCQRYYQKTYEQGTVPASASATNMTTIPVDGNASTNLNFISLFVPMRIAPSVSMWDAAGNSNAFSSYRGSWANNTTSSIQPSGYLSTTSWAVAYTGTPFSTGRPFSFHWIASAELNVQN